jgi:predicted RNA-binding protein YlxR (DUF448 family)
VRVSAAEAVNAVPLRTCLGCRRKAAQRDLVRLLVDQGQVVVDPRRSGGRGAWLHPERECFEEAAKRKAFGRAFRAPSVQAAPGTLRELLTRNTRKD